MLEGAADAGEAGPVACAAARLGAVVAARLGGADWDARAMDRAVEEAERAGSPWLARLGRSLARAARSAARQRCGRQSRSTRGRPRRRTPGGRRCSTWPRPGPRPPIPSGVSRGPTRPRPGSGAWARACSRRGPAAWRRSRPPASGRRTRATTAFGAESAGRAAGSPPARMYAYAALADVDEVAGRGVRAARRGGGRPRPGSSCPGHRPSGRCRRDEARRR